MRNLSPFSKGDLTYKIIGAAMCVHRQLGPGFQEVIYQRALDIELERNGLTYAREQEHPIFYKNVEIGYRRADFVIENSVVVELKAVNKLEHVHLIQTKNYTVAYDFPVGLLINFGDVSLEYKRIFNPNYGKDSM